MFQMMNVHLNRLNQSKYFKELLYQEKKRQNRERKLDLSLFTDVTTLLGHCLKLLTVYSVIAHASAPLKVLETCHTPCKT